MPSRQAGLTGAAHAISPMLHNSSDGLMGSLSFSLSGEGIDLGPIAGREGVHDNDALMKTCAKTGRYQNL